MYQNTEGPQHPTESRLQRSQTRSTTEVLYYRYTIIHNIRRARSHTSYRKNQRSHDSKPMFLWPCHDVIAHSQNVVIAVSYSLPLLSTEICIRGESSSVRVSVHLNHLTACVMSVKYYNYNVLQHFRHHETLTHTLVWLTHLKLHSRALVWYHGWVGHLRALGGWSSRRPKSLIPWRII